MDKCISKLPPLDTVWKACERRKTKDIRESANPKQTSDTSRVGARFANCQRPKANRALEKLNLRT